MKPLSVVLLFVVLSVAGTALAQSRNYTAGVPTPSHHVIIPWTHFGQDPPALAPDSADPPPPQTITVRPVVQPNDAARAPATSSPPSPDAPGAQPSSANPGPELYEADISQKHPHPPEPVDLPLAGQNTAPLLRTLPAQPEVGPQLKPVEEKSVTQTASASANDHSPEGQIAALTAGYQKREADRADQRAQLEAVGAKDPPTEGLAQIEEIRLLLEGEKDRMATSQELSKAFASLGEQLDNRANKVRDLAGSRNETAVTAEAEMNRLNGLVPRREVALRNMAMLPPSNQNDQIIRGLNQELAQEGATRKLDRERSAEARNEMKALQAEAGQLEQAAAVARRKSSNFADASQSAQVNEGLLADRLEYSVARMRAADLLTTASRALGASPVFKDSVQIAPVPAISAVPASTPDAGQTVDQLRDCIRKTGKPDACRTKGDQ